MLASLIAYGGAVRAFTFLGLSWLEWVGLFFSLCFIVYQIPRFLATIYNTFIGPALGLYADLRKMGSWAVVTGSTDGVGKAYAQEIARLGVNIVLISRSKDKLERVAKEIEDEFGVETRVIVADFTQGVEIYDDIRKGLEGLEIGTLINNVGMWYPYAEYFSELPNGDKYCQDLLFCNMFPATMISRMVLPQMCSRGKGVIVNVGSLSSVTRIPLMSVYGAAKAYIDVLSQNLAAEYEDQGIIIQTILPAYVSTKMSRVKKASWTSPSPTVYVRQALKSIGLQKRTAAYLPHRLAMRAMEWSTFWVDDFSTSSALKASLILRQKAKNKREAAKNINVQKSDSKYLS